MVRLLSEGLGVDVPASGASAGPDFAERLSLWLNAFGAMQVHAAHQPATPVAEEQPLDADADAESAMAFARAEHQRVHSALLKGIMQQSAAFQPAAGDEADASFTLYRQRYIDQQRQMALRIAPLRNHARQALSQASAPLQQLATLDAAMDDMLAGREHKLLATVPALLQRRFEHLREAHAQQLAATQQMDDPLRWRQPGGWLDRFGKLWQQVLLAELALRMEPVMGLMEAASQQAGKEVNMEVGKEVSTCP